MLLWHGYRRSKRTVKVGAGKRSCQTVKSLNGIGFDSTKMAVKRGCQTVKSLYWIGFYRYRGNCQGCCQAGIKLSNCFLRLNLKVIGTQVHSIFDYMQICAKHLLRICIHVLCIGSATKTRTHPFRVFQFVLANLN